MEIHLILYKLSMALLTTNTVVSKEKICRICGESLATKKSKTNQQIRKKRENI